MYLLMKDGRQIPVTTITIHATGIEGEIISVVHDGKFYNLRETPSKFITELMRQVTPGDTIDLHLDLTKPG